MHEPSERQLQHTAALGGDGDRVDEPVSVANERREGTVHRSVPFTADLVQDDDEPGMGPPNAGCGLDELSRGQREAEHHHHVQSVDVDTVREHRRCRDQVDSVVEVRFGFDEACQGGADFVEGCATREGGGVDRTVELDLRVEGPSDCLDILEVRAVDDVHPIVVHELRHD